VWWIYNTNLTQPNSYLGSAVQQAVSGLTTLPSNMFNGSGAQYVTFGFEYWADPSSPEDGFITWQVDGSPSIRMGADAMAADQGTGGSGVDRRLIPEEPMSIVLNLAISQSFQTVNTATMTFPAELLVEYVRVYQRNGQQNVGCSPKDYPTADYINAHLPAYSNPNLTVWTTAATGANYSFPKNSMASGGC